MTLNTVERLLMRSRKERSDEDFSWILDGFREGEPKCLSCWLPYLVGFAVIFMLVLGIVIGLQSYKVKELTTLYDTKTTD